MGQTTSKTTNNAKTSNKKTHCKNYHAEWKKKNITKVNVEFNKNKAIDMMILEALRKYPSMQGHIKELLYNEIIEKELELSLNTGGKDNEKIK